MAARDPGGEMHAQEFALSWPSDFSVLISNLINRIQ